MFTVWKNNGKVLLAFPKDILPVIQKRLRIYILRDKVTISDISSQYNILGIFGDNTLSYLGFPEDATTEAYTKTENEVGTLIRWTDAFSKPRWLFFTKRTVAISEKHLANENTWLLTEIEAGMPRINLATQDRFLPQMLNLEPLGGLSFAKGCYPGQEIISRAQYRGAIKSGLFKGMLPIDGNIPPSVPDGTKLFDESGNECGTLIMSAIDSHIRHCLAVARFDSTQTVRLYPCGTDGIVMNLLPCCVYHGK